MNQRVGIICNNVVSREDVCVVKFSVCVDVAEYAEMPIRGRALETGTMDAREYVDTYTV